MNWVLVIAALFAAFTAAVHVLAGGTGVVEPLLASSLDGEPKLTLYAVWHMVTLTLSLSAVAFLVGSFRRYAEKALYLVTFLSVLWCGFGLVYLIVIATQPPDNWLFKLPQWVLLLPVGLLGLLGGLKTVRHRHAQKAGPPEPHLV